SCDYGRPLAPGATGGGGARAAGGALRAAPVSAQRQRAGVHRTARVPVARADGHYRLHRPRQAVAERGGRELPQPLPGRVPGSGMVSHAAGGPGPDRAIPAAVQRGPPHSSLDYHTPAEIGARRTPSSPDYSPAHGGEALLAVT